MRRALLTAILTTTLSFAQGVAGLWELNAENQSGDHTRVELLINEKDGKYTASIEVNGDSIPTRDLAVEGHNVSFKVSSDDETFTVKLTLNKEAAGGTFSTTSGRSGKVIVKKL